MRACCAGPRRAPAIGVVVSASTMLDWLGPSLVVMTGTDEHQPVAMKLRRAARWSWSQLRLLVDVRSNPATFIYLFTLFVTSAIIGAAGARLSGPLLRSQSTNLTNLRHDPLHVLFTSAFWLSDGLRPIFLVIPFAFVLAPAERWLGTWRWLVVFVTGHVGASLLTAVVIWAELQRNWTPTSLTHTVDVGVSYGFAAVLGVLTYRVPPRWRLLYLGAVLGTIAIGLIRIAAFTDIGHVIALGIGLGCRSLIPQPSEGSADHTRERVAR